MYGWINTCLEQLILTNFDEEVWQNIKTEAQCSEKIGEWLRYENYSDAQTYALFAAASKILNVEKDALMEIFGGYFLEFMRDEGYLDMLKLLGTNLREWLSNVNTFHTHLKNSLVEAKFPLFWCTDDPDADGVHESMIFHHQSKVSTQKCKMSTKMD